MQRRSWLLRTAVGAAALTALTALPAAADSIRPAATGRPAAAPAAAVDPAVASLAAERGLSVPEATVRIGWQHRAPALADAARARLGAKGFGGTWIGDDDRVKVGVAGPAASTAPADVDRLAAANGLAGAVDVVPVRRGLQELESVQQQLVALFRQDNLTSAWPLLVAVAESDNVVELRLPPAKAGLSSRQQAVLAAARARFGPVLREVRYPAAPTVTACGLVFCDPPLRGGVRIDAPTGGSCTGGFLARSRSDQALYLVTAGHCGYVAPSGNWTQKFPDGSVHVIGAMHNWVFGTRGDAAITRVNNPAGWSARAWVYVGPSAANGGVAGTAVDPEYRIAADGSGLRAGTRICKTGATAGTQCGKVVDTGVTVYYKDPLGSTRIFEVGGLGEASFTVQLGDSGGPVFANHTAYGVVSGTGGTGVSFYQGIQGAENLMGVNLSHEG